MLGNTPPQPQRHSWKAGDQLYYIALPEETVFRGFLISHLCTSLNAFAATTISSILFGAIHYISTGRFLRFIATALNGMLLSLFFLLGNPFG
ncbi:MAG: CPBP family intramembrane metalloprotease [archaeon GB-1867-005]|nr:CPBP family intramembrane metalloprotease [Candidatus Culexmicrobium cathedralense]